MGIDITAYDCGRPCELWLGPKGEGVPLLKDLKNLWTRTQIQPNLPKILKSCPYRQILINKFGILYRFYKRQVIDTKNIFDTL